MLSRLLIEPFHTPFMARALVEVLLLGVVAGAAGVFVVLRQLVFLSDTLTHTVFPGVVAGYLVAQESGILPGALIAGLLSAVLFTLVAATRKVTEDATLAIMLTAFFSVGVVLVSRQRSYTADLTTFLFGRVLTVDRREIIETTVAGAVCLAVLVLLGKELLLRAFDPEAARTMGYPVVWLDLALNVVIALVVVAAVKAVGTVLVIALLIVPAAAARLLTDRIAALAVLSVGIGALGGWLGLAASYEAAIHHGVRLASGVTVVLALVVLYAVALAVAPLWRAASGRRSAAFPPLGEAS